MTTTNTRKSNLRHVGPNWIGGTVDRLEVQAKVFTEPSQFGMDEDGRISKLWIRDSESGKVLYSYDRGYDFVGIMPESLAMVVAAVGEAIK